MKQTHLFLPGIQLIGVQVRTNNQAESHPATAKIGSTLQRYMQDQIAHLILKRKSPGKTFCVYTDYESDMKGDYTYFIGEEVEEFEPIPEGLAPCVIPAQTYTRFTTEAGIFPAVVIKAWQEIWRMSEHDLGGARGYQADFEVYDERAQNPQEAVLDIYIGLKSEK